MDNGLFKNTKPNEEDIEFNGFDLLKK